MPGPINGPPDKLPHQLNKFIWGFVYGWFFQPRSIMTDKPNYDGYYPIGTSQGTDEAPNGWDHTQGLYFVPRPAIGDPTNYPIPWLSTYFVDPPAHPILGGTESDAPTTVLNIRYNYTPSENDWEMQKWPDWGKEGGVKGVLATHQTFTIIDNRVLHTNAGVHPLMDPINAYFPVSHLIGNEVFDPLQKWVFEYGRPVRGHQGSGNFYLIGPSLGYYTNPDPESTWGNAVLTGNIDEPDPVQEFEYLQVFRHYENGNVTRDYHTFPRGVGWSPIFFPSATYRAGLEQPIKFSDDGQTGYTRIISRDDDRSFWHANFTKPGTDGPIAYGANDSEADMFRDCVPFDHDLIMIDMSSYPTTFNFVEKNGITATNVSFYSDEGEDGFNAQLSGKQCVAVDFQGNTPVFLYLEIDHHNEVWDSLYDENGGNYTAVQKIDWKLRIYGGTQNGKTWDARKYGYDSTWDWSNDTPEEGDTSYTGSIVNHTPQTVFTDILHCDLKNEFFVFQRTTLDYVPDNSGGEFISGNDIRRCTKVETKIFMDLKGVETELFSHEIDPIVDLNEIHIYNESAGYHAPFRNTGQWNWHSLIVPEVWTVYRPGQVPSDSLLRHGTYPVCARMGKWYWFRTQEIESKTPSGQQETIVSSLTLPYGDISTCVRSGAEPRPNNTPHSFWHYLWLHGPEVHACFNPFGDYIISIISLPHAYDKHHWQYDEVCDYMDSIISNPLSDITHTFSNLTHPSAHPSAGNLISWLAVPGDHPYLASVTYVGNPDDEGE